MGVRGWEGWWLWTRRTAVGFMSAITLVRLRKQIEKGYRTLRLLLERIPIFILRSASAL